MANEEPTDLDWVQLRRDMGPVHHVETTGEKFARKFSENPFVPIGNSYIFWYVNRKICIFRISIQFAICPFGEILHENLLFFPLLKTPLILCKVCISFKTYFSSQKKLRKNLQYRSFCIQFICFTGKMQIIAY